jgi:putative flippase GtrA
MKCFSPLPGRVFFGQAVRFVAAGLVNSGITWLLYLMMLRLVSYTVAYTVSFIAGIAIALLLNGKWVFRARLSARSAVQFPVIYGVQYLLGIALLIIFVGQLQVPKAVAPLAVVACTTPLTFLAVRFIFRSA